MRALVTGGAGFIGCNLVGRLAALGHQVVAADDFSNADRLSLAGFSGDVVKVDFAGGVSAVEKIGPFDVIFHQASITDTTVTDRQRMLHNNVDGFRTILDLALKWNCRVVWASSASIYGHGPSPMKETQDPQPLNVYASSKLEMEKLAEQYMPRLKRPIVALRYFNVYGPHEDHKGKFASMIHQLARQMRGGKRPRIFTDGRQRRDFVLVDDVVQANLKAIDLDGSGVFNVGSGNSDTFNSIVAELNRALKTDLQPDYFENPYGFTQDRTQADLTHSRKVLGYSPKYNLTTGIDAYLASGYLGTSRT
jgi:ADP-L-glycero-D-manno-heptose 6-epimerase